MNHAIPPRPWTGQRLLPVAAMLLLGMAGCDSGSSAGGGAASGGGGTGLADIVLSTAPAGYTLDPSVSGTQSAELMAAATPLPTDAVIAELDRDHYAGGLVRIWTNGPSFVSVLAFRFARPPDAALFLAFEASALAQAVNTYVFATGSVPGATGFILNGEARSGGRRSLCEAVAFRAGHDVFQVETCAPQPASASQAERLAADQYRAALAADPGAAVTPVPTTGPVPPSPDTPPAILAPASTLAPAPPSAP